MITESQKRFILNMLEHWVACHRLVSAKLGIENYLAELIPKEDSMSLQQFWAECALQHNLVIEKLGCEKVSRILNRTVSYLDDLSSSEASEVIASLKKEGLGDWKWQRSYKHYVNDCEVELKGYEWMIRNGKRDRLSNL